MTSPQQKHASLDFLSPLWQSNAVFTVLLVALLAVYFGSERSVLHFRSSSPPLSVASLIAPLHSAVWNFMRMGKRSRTEPATVDVQSQLAEVLFSLPCCNAQLLGALGCPTRKQEGHRGADGAGGMHCCQRKPLPRLHWYCRRQVRTACC